MPFYALDNLDDLEFRRMLDAAVPVIMRPGGIAFGPEQLDHSLWCRNH